MLGLYQAQAAGAALGNYHAMAQAGLLFMLNYLGIRAFAAGAEWLTGKGKR
jgi:hypothetical protein